MEKITERVEMIRMLSEPSAATSTAVVISHSISLLYPEQLTLAELKQALKEYMVSEDKLKSNNKDDLLQIAYRFCVPKPQREYRSRGSSLNCRKISSTDTSVEDNSNFSNNSPTSDAKRKQVDAKDLKRLSSADENDEVNCSDKKRKKHSPVKWP